MLAMQYYFDAVALTKSAKIETAYRLFNFDLAKREALHSFI